jgi:hypothetical protein
MIYQTQRLLKREKDETGEKEKALQNGKGRKGKK